MVTGISGILVLIPYVFPGRQPEIAEVDPEFCNGCGWCFADCPYEAISMKNHDYKPGLRQAVVLGNNCVSCGICAGACLSATPFKSINLFKSGINLPDRKIRTLLDNTRETVLELTGQEKTVIFGCDEGAELEEFADDSTMVVSLPCIGQLPPSYIDFLIRKEHIDNVLLTGCAEDNCFYRFGNDLMSQRVNRMRNPHIKHNGVRRKTAMVWSGLSGEQAVAEQLAEIKAAEHNGEDRAYLSGESIG